jgi:hypothetical protein
MEKFRLKLLSAKVKTSANCEHGTSYRQGSKMSVWEYKVFPIKTRIRTNNFEGSSKPIIDDVQTDLNILGREGWELVSVQDITLQDGRMFTVAYLKRESRAK